MSHEALKAKTSGNSLYSAKRYQEAIEEYQRAIFLIENEATSNSETIKSVLIIQGNISACELLLGHYMNSIDYCNLILESENRKLLETPFIIKTLLRRIQSVLDAAYQLEIEWNLVKNDLKEAKFLIETLDSNKRKNFEELCKVVEQGISEGMFLSFPRVNFLKEIPNEVVFDHILPFFQPNDLLKTSLVNRQLWNLSNNGRFWLEHCKTLWKDKLPRNKYEILKNPKPKSKSWKIDYYESIGDSKRLTITMEELQNLEWKMVFKQKHMGQQLIDVPLFGKDGIYSSQLFDNEFPYKLIEDGLAVQIAEYPFLHVDRTKNWSFHLENLYVDFFSQ
eukprot:gene2762-4170_t